MNKKKPNGNLFVVSAPSGAGKTTLVRTLARHLREVKISISHTTRPPRPDDREGIDYFFVSEARFDKMIQEGAFLEYATIYSYHYGTTKDWVLEQLHQGHDVLLEIDWQGARQIRNFFPPATLIFILPPSAQTLKERLLKRRQDSLSVIHERLAFAQSEIMHYREFDYLVLNDNLEQAIVDLTHIVRAQSLRQEIQAYKMANLLAELTQTQ